MELANRAESETRFAANLARSFTNYRARIEPYVSRGEEVPESVWSEIETDMKQRLTAILLLLFVASATQHGLDAPAAEAAGLAFAEGRANDTASQFVANSRDRLGNALAGESLDPTKLQDTLVRTFGPDRAASIAVTETTVAASAGGENATATTVGLNDLDLWFTAADNRVCFPAGTRVATSGGTMPIEALRVGDMVLTRGGMQPVTAVCSRNYCGRFVDVSAGPSRVLATQDHPFWTLEEGWLSGFQLRPGHTLQSVGEQRPKIDAAFNLSLQEANSLIPMLREEGVLSSVPLSVSMPVRSVNFNGHKTVGYQKVDRIPPHLGFLNILDANRIKGNPHGTLKQCFASTASVARKATKLTIDVRWLLAELLATGDAFNHDGWPTALLRAVMPVKVLLCAERLSASLANNVLSAARLAFDTASRVAVRNACVNGKDFAANGTRLRRPGNPLHMAFSGATQVAANFRATRSEIELLSADRAYASNPRSLSLLNGKLHRYELTGHAEMYHDPCTNGIRVYDIQVANEPEFFANGILVHNCKICGPLHATKRSTWQERFPQGPPGHVNCRCYIEYVHERN